jgi:4-amino-4-deoxy-L-arabinose transferase-like glycosyltransferase
MEQTALTSPDVQEERTERATSLSWRDKLVIIVFGCSLLLTGLGLRTLTRHEVLAAYPAKEMLLYGHWIVPMYAGIERTAKPPGMNWIVAGFMKVFRSDSEFIVRLPSALAGVASGLMIASFAARYYGRRIGIVSGLMVLTSFYVLIQARLAESDMLLTALVCAAMLIFASGPVREAEDPSTPQKKFRQQLLAWRPITFYLITGLTFLLKGFVGPAFILLGTISYAVIQRHRRSAYFLLNPLGILLFLALVAVWPVVAYLQYPGILESWRFEQFGRLTGERGSNPFYYYLYSIPGSLLPWTPLMIGAAWIALKHGRHRRPLNRFFICWFIAGVILLSLSSFKHQHYAYPLMPPLAILGAMGLLQYIEYQHFRKTKLHRVAAAGLIAVCVALSILVHVIERKVPGVGPIGWPVTIIIGVLGVGGLVAIYMEYERRLVVQLAAIFATAWIVCVLVQILIIPLVDDYKPDADLARAANGIAPGAATIYIIDPEPRVEPHSAWYLRPPIRRFRNVDEFLANTPGRAGEKIYVITNTAQSTKMGERGTVQTLATRQNPLGKTKPRDLIFVSYVKNP